jgi:hypothetical protein
MRPPSARESKALGPHFCGEVEERPGVGAKRPGRRHGHWGPIPVLAVMSGLPVAFSPGWDLSRFGVSRASRMVGDLAGPVPRLWGSPALGPGGTSRMAG